MSRSASTRGVHPCGARSALDAQLNLVARCVEASVASRVFPVSLGGFDLHADGKKSQENLLGELDRALVSFVDRMAGSAAGRRVVVAVYSEFGRWHGPALAPVLRAP